MVLLNKTDFTTASAVNINNCFSSTYQAYRIVSSISSPTSDCVFKIRLRVNGTDSTSSYFGTKISVNDSGTVGAYGDVNASALAMFSIDSANTGTVYSIFTDLINPFATSVTTFFMNNNGVSNAGTFNAYIGGGYHNVSTSYDGFTIYPEAGTVSGTVRVYGMKN